VTGQGESLEALRIRLAPALADAAVFDGWGDAAVRAAAQQAGVDENVALFAFSEGQMAMIAAFAAHVDQAMELAFPAEVLAGMKVRERIRALVAFRLEAIKGRGSVRRAMAIMARPGNAAATRLGWGSADAMWRLAGDTATDFNHYTKRATLAGLCLDAGGAGG
jgi:ubiquinone biosynthesis protein COQ9